MSIPPRVVFVKIMKNIITNHIKALIINDLKYDVNYIYYKYRAF